MTFTPEAITGCPECWVPDDASAVGNGNPVSSWSSRTLAHAMTATTTKRPTYSATALNGQPGLTFVAANSQILAYTAANALSTSNTGSIFVLFKITAATAGAQTLWSTADTGTANFYLMGQVNTALKVRYQQKNNDTADQIDGFNALATGTLFLVEWQSTGTEIIMRINGVNIGAYNWVTGSNNGDWFVGTDTPNRDNFCAGGLKRNTESGYFNGVLGPIIPVNGIISDADRLELYHQVNDKYGMSVGDNDFFEFATDLGADSGGPLLFGDFYATGPETDEPNPSGGPSGGPYKSVWFKYTPSVSGKAKFAIDVDTLAGVAVYSGSDLASLEEIVSVFSEDYGPVETAPFDVVGGETYYVQVSETDSSDGSLAHALTWTGPAPGDMFADAIDLGDTLNHSGSYTNVNATTETGEPVIGGYEGLGPFKSIWFKFHTTTAGRTLVSVPDSEFIVTMGVFTGSSVGGLTQVASTFDGPTGIRFRTEAGGTYYIGVGSYNEDDEGAFTLSLDDITGTVDDSDSFGAAEDLGSEVSGAISHDDTYATLEAGEPQPGAQSVLGSLWAKWTAPETGTLSLNTAGGTHDTVLAIYTSGGASLSDLIEVDSNDDSETDFTSELIDVPVTSGVIYYIQYGPSYYAESFGTLHLAWEFTPAPPPPPTFPWLTDEDGAGDLVVLPYQYEFRGWLGGSGTAFVVEKVEGLLSSPPVDDFDLPLMEHGSTPGVIRQQKRTIAFDLKVVGSRGFDIESKLAEVRRVFQLPRFRNTRKMYQLVFSRPGQPKRFVWCRCTNRDFTSEYATARGLAGGSVEVQAPDPTIYTVEEFSQDVVIASGNVSQDETLVMGGDYAEGVRPILHFYGPMRNPLVMNSADDGRTVRLALDIPAGDELVIDRQHRCWAKSASEEDWTQRPDFVRNDNQWWNLLPGDNLITIDRSGTGLIDDDGTLTISWRDGYA